MVKNQRFSPLPLKTSVLPVQSIADDGPTRLLADLPPLSSRLEHDDLENNGRCPHNVRIDEKRPLLASTLIKCVACGRCTCIDCLDRLATLGTETVEEHESVDLVFQRTEELEALLSALRQAWHCAGGPGHRCAS